MQFPFPFRLMNQFAPLSYSLIFVSIFYFLNSKGPNSKLGIIIRKSEKVRGLQNSTKLRSSTHSLSLSFKFISMASSSWTYRRCHYLITTCRASGENKNTRRVFVRPRWVRTIPVRPFNRDVHLYSGEGKTTGRWRSRGGGGEGREKNNCERSNEDHRLRSEESSDLAPLSGRMLLPSPRYCS